MEKKKALEYVRKFMAEYWANEHAHDAWDREIESKHNVTAKQFALLKAIQRSADITTSDLTELLGKAQPAITQMLNRLDQHGFIKRTSSKQDRRRRPVVLTAKAENLLAKIEPIGPTRAVMALEHASEPEARKIVSAMKLVREWMTDRPVT